MKVKNYIELKQALENREEIIELVQSIPVPTSLSLNVGTKLKGINENIFLSFINGDGIGLKGNNEVSNLSIQTSPEYRAIYLDSLEKDLKTITLNDLSVTGMVQILTHEMNETLDLTLSNIHIVSADARKYSERPMKYGVNVYQGALTVYNFNPDPKSVIKVVADNISVGVEKAPVIGSGLFFSGFNDEGGRIEIERLTTGNVYSNGMIPTGQPNLITGGIFIVYGAHAKEIISNGVTKTYGTNDMVLDVWGSVDNWTVKDDVVSYGASGIGFVNFGRVSNFRAEKNVITYGLGARGFNQYDGTIDKAYFYQIQTMGDGSIGMQFSKPVGEITLEKGVVTAGSVGKTLVKGVIKELAADGISVLTGGSIDKLVVKGDIVTHGHNVVSLNINGGEIQHIQIDGKIEAFGSDSEKVVVANNGQVDLSFIK